MASVSKDILTRKKADVQTRFEQLQSEKNKLIEQQKAIEQRVIEISQEQIRLQGEFRLIEDLSGNNKEPTPKIPSNKKN
jgi:predicted nuclease with TOPRIM domain